MYREVNEMPKCTNCGILIPSNDLATVFEHHGVALLACSDRCVRIYDTYKFPRYRDEILAAEAAGHVGRRLGYVRGAA